MDVSENLGWYGGVTNLLRELVIELSAAQTMARSCTTRYQWSGRPTAAEIAAIKIHTERVGELMGLLGKADDF